MPDKFALLCTDTAHWNTSDTQNKHKKYIIQYFCTQIQFSDFIMLTKPDCTDDKVFGKELTRKCKQGGFTLGSL